MKEIWKDIKGYEGLYQVSNLGRVKSLNFKRTNQNKILKLSFDKKGYNTINIYKNKKISICKVHRLVAQTFIPNPENKPQVNHINGIKTDNSIQNLEWCTSKENIHHARKTGLIKGGNMDVNKERDLRFIKEFQKITLATICKELNVDKPSIYRGTASAENIKKVRNEIEKRISELPH